jgi:hypothetical protein
MMGPNQKRVLRGIASETVRRRRAAVAIHEKAIKTMLAAPATVLVVAPESVPDRESTDPFEDLAHEIEKRLRSEDAGEESRPPAMNDAGPEPPIESPDDGLDESLRWFRDPERPENQASFETPPANGEYRGRAPVRTIAPGIHGDEVQTLNVRHLVRGAIWKCGRHRVRIGTVDHRNVGFVEMGRPSARGVMPRQLFLRQYRPE